MVNHQWVGGGEAGANNRGYGGARDRTFIHWFHLWEGDQLQFHWTYPYISLWLGLGVKQCLIGGNKICATNHDDDDDDVVLV